ncbi:Retrovirus-related Pol polyprotein [Stylophora pistillata]|uniref:Retrovirus-related Pol polyprotein n=1 Tax=Stylophora pistillata TaxID=50429 RepID=A0A2B4R6E4_STYPI|nr:Retrovirus-related Pol polyprotein [Stylophora pistillata]
MPDEGGQEENNTNRGKAGVLASVKASVGTIDLKGEPGQREKAWKLWRDRFERAIRWMAVSGTDKLFLCGKTLRDKLQKLQNRAARVLTFSNYDADATELLEFLGWKNLARQQEIHKATMMFRCLHGLAPRRLRDFDRNVAAKTAEESRWQVRAIERELDTTTRQPEEESETNEEVYLYRVTGEKSSNPTVTLQVNKVPLTQHLDTQADVKVITEKHFGRFKGTSSLQPTKAIIRSYSGDGPGPALWLLGCLNASLRRKHNNIVEVVYVVKGQGNTALLGRQVAGNMSLIEYHIEQTTQAPAPVMKVERQEIHTLISEYDDVLLETNRQIHGDNVVLTPKKDGESVRASLDMTDVNRYIKRTRHTIPTLRELETRLNDAKFFSQLDMNDGYMQLELAEESRKLKTFHTHRGLKRFKRLHFGVNSVAEIFNEEVQKVVSLEPNAISIYYDVLVFGALLEEHDRALRRILQQWRSHGLTLNMKKSRFNLCAVTFFGKVLCCEGNSRDPNKVAALQAAGPPQSQAEVRSFLFFAGANADFMEGFAQVTALLRNLIKQGAPFQRTPECQRAFEQTKTLLSRHTVMAYLDPHRKTKLVTDAGPRGLAVTLKQYDPQAERWRPVTYRSGALSNTETRYSL